MTETRVKITGNDIRTVPPSLQILIGSHRLIVDPGDNTQRCYAEHGLKLCQTRTILLTNANPSSCGGLLGTLLTIQAGTDQPPTRGMSIDMFSAPLQRRLSALCSAESNAPANITVVDESDKGADAPLRLISPPSGVAYMKQSSRFCRFTSLRLKVREINRPVRSTYDDFDMFAFPVGSTISRERGLSALEPRKRVSHGEPGSVPLGPIRGKVGPQGMAIAATETHHHQPGGQGGGSRATSPARCDVGPCDAARCDAARCDAARCDAARCDAARCDAARCGAARCDAGRCKRPASNHQNKGGSDQGEMSGRDSGQSESEGDAHSGAYRGGATKKRAINESREPEPEYSDESSSETMTVGGSSVTASTLRSREWSAVDKDYVIYVLRTKPTPGRLHRERAEALGLPPGPLYKNLKMGESVTVNGRVIKPEDVCDPEQPGKGILLVPPIPRVEMIGALQKTLEIIREYCGSLDSIFHLGAREIVESARYQDILNLFPKTSSQCFVDQSPAHFLDRPFRISAVIEHLLYRMSPSLFLPLHLDQPVSPSGNGAPSKLGRLLTEYVVAPRPMIRDTEPVLADVESQVEAMMADMGLVHVPSRALRSGTLGSAQLWCLGTGSAYPSVVRNVSSYLFQMEPETGILLDAGEGCLAQLARYAGPDLDLVINNLRVIFCSHSHGDHHLGLPTLLHYKERVSKSKETLYIICPKKMTNWMQYCSRRMSIPVKILSTGSLAGGWEIPRPDGSGSGSFMMFDEVDHIPESFGCRINIADGPSLAYSGDTRPTDSFVELARDATLMVHEATFFDDTEWMAEQKRHSSFTQAVDIARRARVSSLLVTHFSQRYARFEALLAKAHEMAPDQKFLLFSAQDGLFLDLNRLGEQYKEQLRILPYIEDADRQRL